MREASERSVDVVEGEGEAVSIVGSFGGEEKEEGRQRWENKGRGGDETSDNLWPLFFKQRTIDELI